jgi:glycerol uptake facilitator-like aquaporin
MNSEPARRLLAEAVGTGILVLFGAGSVVAALTLNAGELGYAGLGMIAITFALAIAVAIYAFGTTSGAHISPAVTVSLAAVGRFPWSQVPAYIVAQLIGATVGAALIWASFGGDAVDFGMGQTSIADGTNYLQAIVAEALGTFLLVTAIMALAVDRRAPGGWAGRGHLLGRSGRVRDRAGARRRGRCGSLRRRCAPAAVRGVRARAGDAGGHRGARARDPAAGGSRAAGTAGDIAGRRT